MKVVLYVNRSLAAKEFRVRLIGPGWVLRSTGQGQAVRGGKNPLFYHCKFSVLGPDNEDFHWAAYMLQITPPPGFRGVAIEFNPHDGGSQKRVGPHLHDLAMKT